MANIDFKSDKFKYFLFISGIVLLVSSLIFSIFNITQYLFLSMIVIPFGLLSVKYINSIGKTIGDMSYGIYIFAFPVQQTLMFYFNLNYKILMFFSLILTILLSYLSLDIVEKLSLELKKYKPNSLIVSMLIKERMHAK